MSLESSSVKKLQGLGNYIRGEALGVLLRANTTQTGVLQNPWEAMVVQTEATQISFQHGAWVHSRCSTDTALGSKGVELWLLCSVISMSQTLYRPQVPLSAHSKSANQHSKKHSDLWPP